MSLFFPGCKVLFDRFTKDDPNEVAKLNPFTGILQKYRALHHQCASHEFNQPGNYIVMEHSNPCCHSDSSPSSSVCHSPSSDVHQPYHDDNSSVLIDLVVPLSFDIQEEYYFDQLY